MKVSVIIPVYNVKPYLERCVQSVLGQTYKDIEMILVDDGSTDGSGDLCEQLASKYSEITVIHQSNQGISGARNTGLLHAKGQYIAFLDADDAWLQSDGLKQLMQKAETTVADLVIFKVVHIWEKNRRRITQDYDVNYISSLRNCSEVFTYLVCTQQFNMSACFLLVRKQLLLDYRIYFPMGFISEDVYWSIHLWQHVQSVSILNLDFYGYYHRNASVSTTTTIRVYESYDKIFMYWREQCNKGCLNHESIRYYLADMWVNRGYNYLNLNVADRPEALDILRRNMDLLHYAQSRKAKRVARLVRLFGLNRTVVLLGCYWLLRSLVIKNVT